VKLQLLAAGRHISDTLPNLINYIRVGSWVLCASSAHGGSDELMTPIMSGLPRDASALLEGATPSPELEVNRGVYVTDPDTVVRSDSYASWLQVFGGSGAQLYSA
jgi:hypothetical protein